ncbi:MAG: hypothetical protein HY291_01415 [Planctomycetes bacterium]|nr:hypothetical protein [Planctomycetota bacterium]
MIARLSSRVAGLCALLAACTLLSGCSGEKRAENKTDEGKTPQMEKTAAEKTETAKTVAAKTDAAKSEAGKDAKEAGEAAEVSFGKSVLFTAKMPKAWASEEPENKMRTYQAKVPKQGEDKEDAQLQIFKMNGAGGAEETLKRWQTNQWGGQDSMEERREVKTKLGGEATVATFSGTYTAMDFSPDKKEAKENFMMLGAIVPTSEGTFYIKLVGPRATIEANRDAFETMIKSFDKKQETAKP